jgi:hypothetical protein
MAYFARKANGRKRRLWPSLKAVWGLGLGVWRSGFGARMGRVWFGRVTLPRDRSSTSIKREHAHKRGNEG